MLVDTHCHLGDPAFAADLAQAMERAGAARVGHVVVVGESREASERALELARGSAQLSATAGIHPHGAGAWDDGAAQWLRRTLADPLVVAGGEMGLDYHYDHSPREQQRVAFEAQLELAERAGKPAVVHAREADHDVAAILRNHPRVTTILHSWSSGAALLEAGLRLGSYFGFSGMVTFRNWSGEAAVRRIPGDRLLLETDAPYLAPVPHRGKRNEPAFLPLIARRMAELLGMSGDEIERVTTANAVRVFGERVAGSLLAFRFSR